MKKILAILLALLMLCTLCACAAKAPTQDDQTADTQTPSDTQTPEDETSAPDTDAPVDETPAPDTDAPADETEPEPAEPIEIESALALLESVWALYGEDEKFPAAGGDYSEENMTDGAPGKVGLDDASSVEYLLTFPAAGVEMIDDAASLIHMMNTNTFTCGAYHLKNAEDMQTLAADVKDHVMNKHWMCGFPDKLVVFSVGEYLVEVFGLQEQVETFCANLAAAYPEAMILSDDPIA